MLKQGKEYARGKIAQPLILMSLFCRVNELEQVAGTFPKGSVTKANQHTLNDNKTPPKLGTGLFGTVFTNLDALTAITSDLLNKVSSDTGPPPVRATLMHGMRELSAEQLKQVCHVCS